MTESQILEILDTWIDRLKLNHWEIIWADLEELPPGAPTSWSTETAQAMAYRSKDYNHSYIVLRDWEKLSRAQANMLIVHELIHLPLRDIENVIDLVDGFLSTGVQNVIREAHDHSVEGAVDWVAQRMIELVGEV
jgi:hypothetical protein